MMHSETRSKRRKMTTIPSVTAENISTMKPDSSTSEQGIMTAILGDLFLKIQHEVD